MSYIKPRIQRARPFIGFSSREEGRNRGIQLGFATYDGDDNGEETYKVSYVEVSGRSDHAAAMINSASSKDVTPQLVSEAGDDAVYVGTLAENAEIAENLAKDKAVKKQDNTATAA